MLDSKIPSGPIENKWTERKFENKLVNPANRRKHTIIVVGSGLAGASAAASLAEQGYKVKVFTYHESPRRAHSIAAQGGINAAKNYQNDGDSVHRLFYDTIKGGDYRAREANVYRLAEVSVNIIDQCVAQGVPFAREYGGTLANRSFGGTQVSRTFYAKGQTGQQLLIGAYSSLMRQVGEKSIELFSRHEMLDLILSDGKARGIVTRNLVTGEITSHTGDAVVLASGGYSNVFFLSTNAKASNATAAWRAYKRGAYMANPCYTQIHPTCIPVSGDHQSKLTLMSESLRNDGRVWVPKKAGDDRAPAQIAENERDYYLERMYPAFGNLVPRDVASRASKRMCDEGLGVGSSKLAVYLDFQEAIERLGESKVKEKYANLFQMYEKITDENPYKTPMRIFPAVHYVMGGLWVDYNLMSNIPGLFVLGEANFSDHGANRLGASALMQGLADGYFVAPYSIGNYLGGEKLAPIKLEQDPVKATTQAVKEKIESFKKIKGNQSAETIHRRLGKIMWDYCGMSREESGLKEAISKIGALKEEFSNTLWVPQDDKCLSSEMEKAGRVSDFLELGELMCIDALERKESCGGHFREEMQTPDGETLRDDTHFSHVAAWEFNTEKPKLHKEALTFEYAHIAQRNYK
ncbi:MAG: fumarate reductase/succinate dehydrogenase flavoprotein subunit [Bdellovibrionales bacterium]|nr:fumarate reductase/succinate dehydrogenase flavoprotein subunit [Bdellovibrionales bacterium]